MLMLGGRKFDTAKITIILPNHITVSFLVMKEFGSNVSSTN